MASFGLALAAFVFTCGEVHESQFSPQTFGHRRVVYYEFPLLELRLTAGDAEEWSTPLADYLRAEGFLEPPPAFTDWVMIKGFKWGVKGWHSSAKSLCTSLRCYQGEDEQWIAWSKAHPELAKEVWPRVVSAVQDYDFSQASEVLYAAREAATLEEFHGILKPSKQRAE